MKTTFFGMSDRDLPYNPKLEHLLHSLPGDATSRRIMRFAVERWGEMLLDPFKHFGAGLTRDSMETIVSPMTQNHSIRPATGNVQLAPYLNPPALHGRWADFPADVPEAFAHAAESYAQHWRAPRTLKRRYSSWMKIIRLSMKHDVCPLPMTSGVAAGIVAHVAEGGASYSELRAVRDSITFVHKYKNLPDPTKHHAFSRVWAGIKREVGTNNPNRKIGLTRAEVGEMIQLALKANREDHAVAMAVCFEGATRISELCAIDVDEIYANDGQFCIARSKTDQWGEGADVLLEHREGAPFDANAMVLAWLPKLGRESGPLLSAVRNGRVTDEPLDGRTFTRFVKLYAAQIGIHPRLVGSHSMRAGWITEELKLERPQAEVAAHVRHANLATLLRYYRPRTIPPNLVMHAKGRAS